ncbi:MAG TPA: hypothetical protein VHF25_14260 [Nitriliruptorales bacterium]|nr:hypothetical protein [Nitriliruptorales bacterium]
MRLLLVTRDASLTVGTSLLPDDHDVAVVGTADALLELGAATFDVAVVDARTAGVAVDVADRLVRQGRARRALLISDEPVAVDERVRMLPRPFTVAELQRQLAKVAADADQDVGGGTTRPSRRRRRGGRWRRGGSGRGTGGSQPGVATDGQPAAPLAAATDSHAGSEAGPGTHPSAQPRSFPRFRTLEPPGPDRLDGHTALLHRALLAGRELEQLMARVPETADLLAVAEPLLDAVVATFQPAQAAVWVVAEDGTWQAVATSGMQAGVRAAPHDPLLGGLRETVDAVLVHHLDGSAMPATDGSAAALRVGDRVDGAITVAAGGLDLAARDRLLDLARSAAPAYALACLLERLRNRRFIRLPETTRRPSSHGSGRGEPGRAPAGGAP